MTNEATITKKAAEHMRYAAERLGIHVNQAYAAAKRGDIPTIKIGKRVLVLTGPFDRMLDGGK